MFFFLILIVGIVKTCTTQSNTGTTFFYNKQIDADCWTKEELNKLRARKIFNQIIPKQTTPDKISKPFIKDALRYYRGALHTVEKQGYTQATSVLREALADTIGGHLRSELLPAARLAYYAGYVPYKHVRDLHDLYDELKMTLNTEGRGWKTPPKVPQISNMTVAKISIGPGKFFNPCDRLVIRRDSNACIQLPIPRVDDANEPTAIALPFKNGGLVSLLSPNAENILLKYYTTATRCILRRSPATCRHADIVSFNNDLWCWMKSDIAPHLMDEKLYAAYGGVLRIAAAVQNYGKVLSRRNLFDFNQKPGLKLWRTLTEPYLFIDSDWTPSLYIAVVVVAAIAICLLQVCYNYILGNVDSCCCLGKNQSVVQEPVQRPVTPRFHPVTAKNHAYYNESQCLCCSTSPIKCTQNSPVKTQRIYDFNENLLDVIMSDAEDDDSSSDTNDEYGSKKGNGHYETKANSAARSSSPPKIETSIEQLRINKGRVGIVTGDSETRDKWAWREDASSPRSESLSTGSSTSRPRARARKARGLAWARRVLVSERSRSPRTKTTLHTEMDSYTTSTSQR